MATVLIVEGLRAEGLETVTKTRDSAFFETDLAARLSERDITTIIIAGVSTHSCILMTAADAYARNIQVVLAEDAIASHDESYHQPVLAMMEQEYRQQRLSVDDIVSRFSQADFSLTP